MRDFQAFSVEHVPRGRETVGERMRPPVNKVAPDRMAEMREMDPDLVRAAGVELAFDLRAMRALGEDAIIGVGLAAAQHNAR